LQGGGAENARKGEKKGPERKTKAREKVVDGGGPEGKKIIKKFSARPLKGS